MTTKRTTWTISRSKIELFLECPRCFYLDRIYKVGRPSGPPFTLNNAVDTLLKRELDTYRDKQIVPPFVEERGMQLVPFLHDQMGTWRSNFEGIRAVESVTGIMVTGAIDDIWQDTEGKLYVVDYKATGRLAPVKTTGELRDSYKRQVEVYQWLLAKQGFAVAEKALFVYCNVDMSEEKFDKRLKFDIDIIPHWGKTDWIEPTLISISKTLQLPSAPPAAMKCEYCNYINKANNLGLF